jgi:two-component system nitrate/nitrite response regulator NarL
MESKRPSRTHPARLLLVDDHVLLRQGLARLLELREDFQVVGEASDGEEAVRQAKALEPDLVLMDIHMPRIDGLEATKLLRAEIPDIKILALTMHDDKETILEMIRSGAKGYVLKNASPWDFVRAVENVLEGKVFFSQDVAEILLDDYVEQMGRLSRLPKVDLSVRERHVLALIAQGFSNKQIGEHLDLSVRTIETYRRRIMSKLNIRTTAGLTRYAVAIGIISGP